MKQFLAKPFARYLLKFGVLFCVFYFGTLLIIGLSSRENMYNPFVANYLNYVTPLRNSILHVSDSLLKLMGYSTTWVDDRTLGIAGGESVRIVYSCVGYGVLSFWASFILANDAIVTKKVIWLLGGWAMLWFLNVLRICFLLMFINKSQYTELLIDHHTLFNIVAYCFIFCMIFLYGRSEKKDLNRALKI